MFKEILKIIPRLEASDLAAMERALNGRFAKVAKKFGGGIVNVLKGGGILGVATALIDKVLNPLKEVQEAFDKSLNAGDDLVTYAKQFNTTEGNLARLQAFGKASGLEPEGVRLLLGKFQAAVAQAAADPSKESAVSAFVGRTDTAEAFFEFIQAMQKLPSDIEKSLVQQEVFGEKQILKASEFLNQDFATMAMQLKGPSTSEITAAAKHLGFQADRRDLLRAQRELYDIPGKASRISQGTTDLMAYGEQVDLARENKRLESIDDLKKISMATDKMVKLLEDAYLTLAPALAKGLPAIIDTITTSIKAVEKSRAIRGLIPGQGKDK